MERVERVVERVERVVDGVRVEMVVGERVAARALEVLEVGVRAVVVRAVVAVKVVEKWAAATAEEAKVVAQMAVAAPVVVALMVVARADGEPLHGSSIKSTQGALRSSSALASASWKRDRRSNAKYLP